ncbi:hypothetical protein E2562_030759 [Oryza meyeriana var. granulata]|uniref:Uncharacterized protein n=1 Tax=Oryza meyeriana var. granulata TaxID=110450 RepID=A0A6G1C8U2_9ORYZ|nr:hypothetical protein E2562_030759 [Oryza meyeriana var. granulata]
MVADCGPLAPKRHEAQGEALDRKCCPIHKKGSHSLEGCQVFHKAMTKHLATPPELRVRVIEKENNA